MKSKKMLALLSVTAVASLGVAACGEDEEATTSAENTPAASESASAEEASVEFVAPSDGETLGDSVTAEVELTGFEVNPDAVGKGAAEGEGHLHFSMDGGEYDYAKYSGANGELAEDLGVDGKYSPSTEPTITYENLPKGEHTLEVYLAENDHTDTGVEAETTFTVE